MTEELVTQVSGRGAVEYLLRATNDISSTEDTVIVNVASEL